MKRRLTFTSVLVIAALLLAAVPAAADDGDPGATIEIAGDGLSFSFSIGEGALAYWAGGETCSGEEFGGYLGEWASEGTVVAPSQIAYAVVYYTVPDWEEGDPIWSAEAYGECSPEPVFDYWGWDASCGYPFVGAGAYLAYEDGEPAVGVEVTFSMEGEDPFVTETDEWGYASADFPFEPGSDPATIWIDAGEWGEASVEVFGPNPEVCEAVSEAPVQVSWPCGQETPSVTLGWTGDIDGMFASIWTEGDEQWEESEGNSITFGDLVPGATYNYYLSWLIEEEAWGWTDGEFTVPEECAAPLPAAPEETWVPRYRMLAVIDYGAVPEYWGQGARNGSCWVKMPTATGKPWVGRVAEVCAHPDLPADFVYTYDKILVDAWVEWNPVTGEWRYPDPLWDPAWADPDYQTH